MGGQLLQPWHPFTKDSTLAVTPGVPIELPVEIFPTNAVIKAGHSLRIAVGPNDFPHAVPPALQLAELPGRDRAGAARSAAPVVRGAADARDVPEGLQAAPGREPDPRLTVPTQLDAYVSMNISSRPASTQLVFEWLPANGS